MVIYRWKQPVSTRSLVIWCVVVFLVLLAWLFRYQDLGSYRGSHILLDRWTGDVYYVDSRGFRQVCDRSGYRADCRLW